MATGRLGFDRVILEAIHDGPFWKEWVVRQDPAGRLLAAHPIESTIGPGTLACGSGACAATGVNGAHGVTAVHAFDSDVNGRGLRELEGSPEGASAATLTAGPTGVVVAVDAILAEGSNPWQGEQYWATYLLSAAGLIAKGCTAVQVDAPTKVATGPCPPARADARATSADPSLFLQDGAAGVYWASPSGNIHCTVTTQSGVTTLCLIGEHDFASPHGCPATGPVAAEISGGTAQLQCGGDPPELPSPWRVLPYGQSLTVAGVTCRSTEATGMLCTDGSSSFVLSRSRATVG